MSRYSQLAFKRGDPSYSGTTIHLQQYDGQVRAKLRLHEDIVLALRVNGAFGGTAADDLIDMGDSGLIRRKWSFSSGMADAVATWSNADMPVSAALGIEYSYDSEDIGRPRRLDRTTHAVTQQLGDFQPLELRNFALYAQVRAHFLEKALKLITGVRWDQHSIYNTQLNARAGAVYRINSMLTTKLLYGSSFKAPSPFLLYAQPLQVGGIIGNINLDPQRADSIELAASFFFLQYFDFSTNVSLTRISNKAEFQPTGINQAAQNVAEINSMSIESKLNVVYNKNLRGFVSLERQFAERSFAAFGYLSQLVGSKLAAYPDLVARTGVTYLRPITNDFDLQGSVLAKYVSARRSSTSNSLLAMGRYKVGEYVALDATMMATYHMSTDIRIHIQLIGRNLFDSYTQEPGFAGYDYPARPRELLLNVGLEL
ncbi:MAG: TonB-dependent receptor [Deltaproteobacteria bacterium]|nr:TonB-dependent receptor [Deltaproteobacteria bacterium]